MIEPLVDADMLQGQNILGLFYDADFTPLPLITAADGANF